ncbi:MAG: His/Gly/Thr/Pro-type tRNA ligase C-terminal domain-containing protein [Candidatus Pacebacteria bacterium]|nr:His/Gly/Thr/Pro-type tRNA ligase C-terminal domain-containing protein [Candidatus Paceibacterota bacterium]
MKQSKLFGKTIYEVPKDEVSKNAQLLIRGGFVDKLMAGVYYYLPLGKRVLSKIENIVREEMNAIGGQEILMSALQKKEDWQTTGRWDIDVMMKVQTNLDKEFGLGWTHEEAVTPLAKKYVRSYKDFPFSLYQIQTKFRNEKRAKSGILRGREFVMKDLYSFHTSEESLDEFYLQAKDAYSKVFKRVGLGDKTYFTYASGGDFSKYSHEFQTLTDAGEDNIHICDKCGIAINEEVVEELDGKCPECGSSDLHVEKAVEVGNIFKLKNRFTDPFNFKFLDSDGKEKTVMMGCYGIGPSRLMGTVVEILSDEKGVVWPKEIAPYQIHLVSLGNSDEVKNKAEEIYNDLQQQKVEVLFDDRGESAGVKLKDSDLIGIPLRVVVSAKTLGQDGVEIKKRSEEGFEIIKLGDLQHYLKNFI